LVGAETAKPESEFPRAPAAMRRVEYTLRSQRCEALAFAGQDVAALRLPGSEGDISPEISLLQSFLSQTIFRQHAEGSRVVVKLRRQTSTMSRFGDARREWKK